jgi:hypothetical protein
MEKEWRKGVYHARLEPDWNTKEWRNLKRQCFYRDRWICLRCDRRFHSSELTAHHLIPRANGGPDSIENLVTMCSKCHDYAEVWALYNRAAIQGSYDVPVEEEPIDEEEHYENMRLLDYQRPAWHKYVYGGRKRNERR